MPVDPALTPLLDLINGAPGPALHEIGPEAAREMYRMLASDRDLVSVRSVLDQALPGPAGDVPVRVVVPDLGEPVGVLVWFHGGGFVIGDLDTSEATARRLAAGAGCVVVSVDYRLAPESPAPAAVDDAWAATRWVADHLEELGLHSGSRIAVGGDSAGGNLAAVVAQRAVTEGGPSLSLQLLVYPTTDLAMAHPSIDENGEGLFLTKDTMAWFTRCYLEGSGVDVGDPVVSPLRASDDVVGRLAPAMVMVAGYDPLRDEGRAYADRLAAAGVEVALEEYPSMIHGFFGMTAITPVAVEATERAARALAESLAS